jgi:aspartate/tyrosine/aromatic aminotransferase
LFESLQAASADAILGLIAEHKNDTRPEKIDLGVGVYRTAAGETPVLEVVKRAEQILIDTQDSKSYIGTAGAADFNAAMQALTFGDAAPDDRLVTIQTPGGSGSLRVAAGMIMRASPDAVVWASEPTSRSMRCWRRSPQHLRATSFFCMPVVTTLRGWIPHRMNARRSPT